MCPACIPAAAPILPELLLGIGAALLMAIPVVLRAVVAVVAFVLSALVVGVGKLGALVWQGLTDHLDRRCERQLDERRRAVVERVEPERPAVEGQHRSAVEGRPTRSALPPGVRIIPTPRREIEAVAR